MGPNSSTATGVGPERSRVWVFRAAVAAVFVAGLIFRILALDLTPALSKAPVTVTRWEAGRFTPYLEHDEAIYIALTQQLAAGKGYTLQGHPILNEPWILRELYDRPLFIRPPGGIALFRVTRGIAGEAGYALAQVLCFVIFFGSTLTLGALVLRPVHRVALPILAILAAFTPIMAQVSGRLWLDGPVLAFATAAAAVFVLGRQRQSRLLVCAAGALLGYASLIKLTAVLVIPGILALGWAVTPREQHRGLFLSSLLFVVIAGLVQIPWEIWQWCVTGSPLPSWATRPAADLVRTNRYVYYVTVIRSPWFYLETLPQVTWTLLPSLVLLAMQWRNRELLKRGAALVLWIAVVLGVHIGLGAAGYSKVLRYVVLVTPATVTLFALVTGGAIQTLRAGQWLPGGKEVTVAVLVLAVAGLSLEVAQGIQTSMVDNRMMDLIRPLPVLSWLIY